MRTTTFKGEAYREVRFLRADVHRGHFIDGTLYVGPSVPDYSRTKAALYITRQPVYGSAWWMKEATHPHWAEDSPEELLECYALLLANEYGFTVGNMSMVTGAWGWPICRARER